jgi:hypothetical protein
VNTNRKTIQETGVAPAIDLQPSLIPSVNRDGNAHSRLHRLLREPLLHFLVLGAFLFWLYLFINGAAIRLSSPNQLEISAPTIELLKNDWRRQWRRDPSSQELQTLIDQYIHDEVFYQEARTLGLDQNDIIVRRRLIQKMEFLAEDVSTLREPTDADLQAYLTDHADRYIIPGRVSFSQIYFSRELRGDRTDADAQSVLNQLQANRNRVKANVQANQTLGDRTMLPATFTLASIPQMTNVFGSTFAQDLTAVTEKGWQGPFHSVYGTHLLHVTAIEPGHAATLTEVRGDVRLDWLNEQRQQQEEAMYQQLRDRYKITIAPDAKEQLIIQDASELEAS